MARFRQKETGARVAKDDPSFVTALARGLDILSCYTADRTALTNSDFAAATGLPKATISRLSYTLCSLDFLRYDRTTGQYTIGPRALSLGAHALRSLDIRGVARPHMRKLADELGMMCGLGAFDGHGVTIVEICRGSAHLTVNQSVGYQLPLDQTAVGLAYLCGLSAIERVALLDRLYPRDGADRERIDHVVEGALAEHAERGFVVRMNSRGRDIHGVAVPLKSPHGGDCYGFNLAGPSFQLKERFLIEEAGPKLARAAQELQSAFNYRPGSVALSVRNARRRD